MKRIAILLLLFLPPILFSWQHGKARLDRVRPAERLQTEMLSALDSLISATNECAEADSSECITQFLAIRRTYKNVEIWADYYQPEYVQDYINGPPLPKTERNTPEARTLEPVGMQVIEEMLLEEQPDYVSIRKQLTGLEASFRELRAYTRYIRPEDRHCFEAMKLALVRLFTLGVSGFDSPGQQQSATEAAIAFQSVVRTCAGYTVLTRNGSSERLKQLNANAQLVFAEKDFVRFDRYALLTKVINPMLQLLVDVQTDLGIEFRDQTNEMPGAVNFRSTSLFAPDFLNVSYFSGLIPSTEDNWKRTLGERLFFDKNLSGNHSMACASCHDPAKGFADGKTTSTGLDGKPLSRNSPGLINAIYSRKFFWDGRAEVVQQQIEHVIVNPREFGSDYHRITERLRSDTTYAVLFKKVYPQFDQPVNRNNILDALTKYVSTLVSWNTRFDKAVRNEGVRLEQDEIAGFNLFMGKAQCGICHFAPVFNGTVPPLYRDSETEIIGVPDRVAGRKSQIDSDQGRMVNGIPGHFVPFYEYSFKTPTVRNATLTAPYMHNGVFTNLRQVIDFYNEGGGVGRGFELPYQTLPTDKLKLTGKEKRQLVAFLKTLEG